MRYAIFYDVMFKSEDLLITRNTLRKDVVEGKRIMVPYVHQRTNGPVAYLTLSVNRHSLSVRSVVTNYKPVAYKGCMS